MEINKEYKGFILKEIKKVKEINARCLLFEHIKSGAILLKAESKDNNKVFNIAFHTLPQNDKGAPHIVEHAVLNGSKKFPVKSPFDELIKGSLSSFLNAMTATDFTTYPIASLNKQEYFNLMDVYLDAVFFPKIYENKNIFLQEGRHYDIKDKNEELKIKGVVYNEMKGAFSNIQRNIDYWTNKNLFDKTNYAFSSGGYPQEIPQLGYEEFLEFHKKHYHPSNSYIFLYGDVDINEELEFIDKEYLSRFKRKDIVRKYKTQKHHGKIKEAEIKIPGSLEESENKNYFVLALICGKYGNTKKALALSIIAQALANMEDSPLKKALLEAKIGKDVDAHASTSKNETVFQIQVDDVKKSDKSKFQNILRKTLEDIVQKGFNARMTEAIMNRFEFDLKEGNGTSEGLVAAIASIPGWIFKNNPIKSLQYKTSLKSLKEDIKKQYLEKTVKKYLLDNKNGVFLTFISDEEITKKEQEKNRQKLQEIKSKINEKELDLLIKEKEELSKYQQSEDTKEALLTIPKLKLKDINKNAENFHIETELTGKNKVFKYFDFCKDIIYATLHFRIDGINKDLLPYLAFLSEIIGDLDTQNFKYNDLDNEISIHTGNFITDITFKDRGKNKFIPLFEMKGKFLSEKSEKFIDICREILTKTIFEEERIQQLLKRHYTRLENFFNNEGVSIALSRLASYYNPRNMFIQQTSGFDYIKFIKELDSDYNKKKETLIKNLQELVNLIFCRSNLFVSICCDKKNETKIMKPVANFIKSLKIGEIKHNSNSFKQQKDKEAFLTASKVQYVCQGNNFHDKGYEYNGNMAVLNQIISRDYLHQELRVLGGAYGGFSSISRDGNFFLASYRDPNLKDTIKRFKKIPSYIKNLEMDKNNMERFIIGTISQFDQPKNVNKKAVLGLNRLLNKTSEEDLQKLRDEILSCSIEKIKKMDEFMEDLLSDNYICVYGNETIINNNKDYFDKLLKL